MPNASEETIFASINDVDALEKIIKIGLPVECLPTEGVRPVLTWAIERYFESGCTTAPSREATLEVWADRLADAEMPLGDGTETDNVEWACDHLKGQFAHLRYQQFLKASGTAMAKADGPEKLDVLAQAANDLFGLTLELESTAFASDARIGIAERFRAYEARAAAAGQHSGLQFGLPEVDQHTYGIHPGELCVLAAGPKTGKSYFLDFVALKEWLAGKRVVLFTLENSVEMTEDRIACIAMNVDARRWQRGECTEAEVWRVREFAEQMRNAPNPLYVLKPKKKNRTPAMLVREAQILGAEVLLIDQLSHVKHSDPGRKAKHEVIGDLMEEFKDEISLGRNKLPLLIAHQINREGVKAARKQGYLEMEMLADGSGVERFADWVFGLFQSPDARIAGHAMLQVLAARREDLTAWELNWRIAAGSVAVIGEVEVAA